MKDKTIRRKINVTLEGKRVRQYVYFAPEDKQYIKEQAAAKGLSVSKYLSDIVLQSINEERQLKMDLN